MRKISFLLLCLVLIASMGFSYSVAIMITGEIGGNPIYEMMVNGAKEAAKEAGFDLKVVEGGYNTAKWEPNVISLAATGQYDLVVTFTEGMPKSVEKVAKMFPNQKLALLDGLAENLPNIFSLGFKDEEMSYLAGAFAGMVTTSDMPGANKDLKVGLLAGDIYPAMTDRMKPAYENGAKSINKDIELIFSAAGSWSDPNKGEDLSEAQLGQGVDIILTIAGGTGMGAIEAASNSGNYIIGVDSNYISMAPETILACTLKNADIAIKDVLIRAFNGNLPFGTSERWGIKEGAIGFTFDDPNYIKNVPEDIREKMLGVFNSLKDGEINPSD
ncbi:MAG: riboflavin transport system substrate-binding protein [Kosmotogales bacterium]|nr:riboflavin transport system substrate-binding protein [Kosmotogales bacterium]